MTKQFIYFDKEEELEKLLGLNQDQIWDHGINLDDWDYGVLFYGNETPSMRKSEIRNLLNGVCSNEWVVVTIDGKNYTVGMSYHS
jgi:hypothetical protein